MFAFFSYVLTTMFENLRFHWLRIHRLTSNQMKATMMPRQNLTSMYSLRPHWFLPQQYQS